MKKLQALFLLFIVVFSFLLAGCGINKSKAYQLAANAIYDAYVANVKATYIKEDQTKLNLRLSASVLQQTDYTKNDVYQYVLQNSQFGNNQLVCGYSSTKPSFGFYINSQNDLTLKNYVVYKFVFNSSKIIGASSSFDFRSIFSKWIYKLAQTQTTDPSFKEKSYLEVYNYISQALVFNSTLGNVFNLNNNPNVPGFLDISKNLNDVKALTSHSSSPFRFLKFLINFQPGTKVLPNKLTFHQIVHKAS